MRVTIIRDDNAVYVDGRPHEVNCSELPPDVHAVQWDGKRGEVEYRDVTCAHCGTTTRKPNARIDDFTPYEGFVSRWQAAKNLADARAEAARAAAAAKAAEVAAGTANAS